MYSGLKDCCNIHDLRRLAEKRLPGPIYHYLEGGADDEYSLRNNTAAFDNFHLLPRCLTDVSDISTRVKVLGQTMDWPVMLAPTGMSRMFHPGGERAVAKAAGKSGVYYSLSTFATATIEEIAVCGVGPKMFQLYVIQDSAVSDELIDRCKVAGYNALCLTVDTVVGGNRERDLRTGMSMPPRLTSRSLCDFMLHPRWCWRYLSGSPLRLANLQVSRSVGAGQKQALAKYLGGLMDKKLNWTSAERMIARWSGEFAIKGILSVEDAQRAVAIGATAVIVSNHGGRQMDGLPAPIEMISEIVAKVGDRVPVIVDGGIRRGSHILKALALGAACCMIGRPYLYGLAAGGEAGVERALAVLREELVRGMTLTGCKSIREITPQRILRY